MAMTLAQAILSRKSDKAPEEGTLCRVRVDLAFANDITGPPAIRSFKEMGAEKVFDPARCAVLPDHFTPNKDIAAADLIRGCLFPPFCVKAPRPEAYCTRTDTTSATENLSTDTAGWRGFAHRRVLRCGPSEGTF